MATTNIVKNLDELYLYAAITPFGASYGDHYQCRVQEGSPNTLQTVVGTETGGISIGEDVFVLALTAVRAATDFGLNATDEIAFSAGDPRGTIKTMELTVAIDAVPILGTNAGQAGDMFLVLQDPEVDTSTVPTESYVTSLSDTEAGEDPRAVFDKGYIKGQKLIAQEESPNLALAQKFQANDKGLLRFKGQFFTLVGERDVNRLGTVSERVYYFGCYFGAGGPSESSGDSDSEVSLDIGYMWKGSLAV